MPRAPHRYTVEPKLPKEAEPAWATYIAFRGFKVHRTLGQAKSAITNAGHGLLYKWMRPFEHSEDRRWTIVEVVNDGDRKTHPLWRKGYMPETPRSLFTITEEEL